MADNLTPSQRSFAMGQIRSKGNESTEVRLVRVLRDAKLKGWRRHAKIAGRPDFVFPRLRLAIFVDGCFWHGCPECYRTPKSNVEYWEKKITRNVGRDRRTTRALKRAGWKVLRMWEHSLVAPEGVVRRIKRMVAQTGGVRGAGDGAKARGRA